MRGCFVVLWVFGAARAQFTFPDAAEPVRFNPVAEQDTAGSPVALSSSRLAVISAAADEWRLQIFRPARDGSLEASLSLATPLNEDRSPSLALDDDVVAVAHAETGGLRIWEQDGGVWTEASVQLLPSPGRRKRRLQSSLPSVTGTLTCDTTTSARLRDRGGRLYFAFSAPRMDRYRFSTCGTAFDSRVDIFEALSSGAVGSRVAGCDDCGECKPQADLTTTMDAGDYYVVLWAQVNGAGRYTMKVVCGAATPMPSGAPSFAPTHAPSAFEGAVVTDLAFASGGEQLVVAADYRDTFGQTETLYLLERDGSDGWVARDDLAIASIRGERVNIVTRLAVSGETLIAGSPWRPASSATERRGVISLIRLSSASLSMRDVISAPASAVHSSLEFGRTVGATETLILVAGNAEGTDEGVVFVYDLGDPAEPLTTLTPQLRGGRGPTANLGSLIPSTPSFFAVSAFAERTASFVYVYQACDAEVVCQVAYLQDTSSGFPGGFDVNVDGLAAWSDGEATRIFDFSDPPSPAPSAHPTGRIPVELVAVQMADTGASITVEFNVDTDEAGRGVKSFPCAELFSGAALGEERCLFSSPRTVVISLSSASTLQPGDTLSIPPFRLSATSELPDSPPASFESLAVAPPEKSPSPEVLFSHLAVASPCDAFFRIDASNSQNNGGRAFVRFDWSIASESAASLSSDVIASVAETATDLLLLDSTALIVGAEYIVTLEVENYLGEAATGLTAFRMAGRNESRVGIAGTTEMSLRPNRRHTFPADFFPRCDGVPVDLRNYEVRWEVAQTRDATDEDDPTAPPEGDGADTSLFAAAPFTFRGQDAVFEVTYEASTRSGVEPAETAVATITVYPAPEPLVALVSGCNVTISTPAAPALYTIDASRSYDPTVGDAASSAARDAVSTTASPVASSAGCPSPPSLASPEAGVFTFAPQSYVGCTVSFQLVQRSVTSGPLTSLCKVTVLPLGGPVLLVPPVPQTPAAHPNDVSLLANIAYDPEMEVGAVWTLEEGRFRGAERLSLPRSLTIRAGDTAESAPFNLLLDGSTLVPDTAYAFVLAASLPFGDATTAQVRFVVNAPPTAGSVTVAPRAGDAFTLFDLDAPAWTDEASDFPLRFLFTADIDPSAEAAPPVLLQPTTTVRRRPATPLPPGQPSEDFAVAIRVEVADRFGASVASGAVRVEIAQPSDPFAAAGEVLDAVSLAPIASTDDILLALTRAAAMLSGGDWASESAETVADVGLQALDILADVVASRPLTEETLRAEAGVIDLLSPPMQDAAVAAALLLVTGDLTRATQDLWSISDGAGSLITASLVTDDVWMGLVSGIGGAIEGGGAPGLEGVSLVTALLEQLASLAATGQVVGRARSVEAGGVGVGTIVGFLDPLGAGTRVETVGTSAGAALDATALDGAGVQPFEEFLFSVTDLPRDLHASFGVEANVEDGEDVSLLTGVQRLGVGLLGGNGGSLEDAGGVNATFVVPELRDGRVVCARFDADTESFYEFEACAAVMDKSGTKVTCACRFSPSLRSLLISAADDDATFADSSETVSLDLATLLVTSQGTAGATLAFSTTREFQPLVFAILGAVLLLGVGWAWLARMGDQREMDEIIEARVTSSRVLRDWARDRGVPKEIMESLSSEIITLEDLALLRTQPEASIRRVAETCQLPPAAIPPFSAALAIPLLAYLHRVAPKPSLPTPPRDPLDDNLWYGLLLLTPARLTSFKEPSSLARIAGSLRKHHEAYGALRLPPGLHPSRSVRVLLFFANLASALFVNALVFQVIYPDDDQFCADRAGGPPELCLDPASPLNAQASRCSYNGVSGSCVPTTPALKAQDLLIATAFALLFLAPVSLALRLLADAFLATSYPSRPPFALRCFFRRREALREAETKRAEAYVNQEWEYLMEHPEHAPRHYRCIWPACLRRALLRWRVRSAALEAAQWETELDAEDAVWTAQHQAQLVPLSGLRSLAFEHKLLVTKLAARDSLTFAKRLVFRRFTNLAPPAAPQPRWLRLVVVAIICLYVVFCAVYVAAFGLSTSADTAQAWATAVLLSELLMAFLLVVLRIVVLQVVLPTLVRPDVSMERILRFLPHFSAAALLSRQRHDLLPGLNRFFDARFVASLSQQSTPSDASSTLDGKAPSIFTRGAFALLGDSENTLPRAAKTPKPDAEETRSATAQLRDLRTWERKRSSSPTDFHAMHGAGKPSPVHSSPSILGRALEKTQLSPYFLAPPSRVAQNEDDLWCTPMLDYASEEEKDPGERSRVNGTSSDASAKGSMTSSSLSGEGEGKRDGRAGGDPGRLQDGDASGPGLPSVSSTTPSSGSASKVSGSTPHEAPRRRGLVFQRSSAEAFRDVPLSSLASLYSYEGGQSVDSFADADTGSPDVEDATATPERQKRNDAGDDTVGVVGMGKELRRRGCLSRWIVRIVLLLFATILIFPEPLQELLLEEGIPMGLTLLLLVALDVRLADDTMEAGVVVFVVVFVLLTSVVLLATLQHDIRSNVSRVAHRAHMAFTSADRAEDTRDLDDDAEEDAESSPSSQGRRRIGPLRILRPQEAVGFQKRRRTKPITFDI